MKAAIIAAVISPISPAGRMRPRKIGMAYRLSSALALASVGMKSCCKSLPSATVITNTNAQMPSSAGMIMRMANEMEDHMYCRFSAAVLSMASARATAVGQSAQFTMPRKNIHPTYSHPKSLSESTGLKPEFPLNWVWTVSKRLSQPTLAIASQPVTRMPIDRTTNWM